MSGFRLRGRSELRFCTEACFGFSMRASLLMRFTVLGAAWCYLSWVEVLRRSWLGCTINGWLVTCSYINLLGLRSWVASWDGSVLSGFEAAPWVGRTPLLLESCCGCELLRESCPVPFRLELLLDSIYPFWELERARFIWISVSFLTKVHLS